jgi:hypothetical protein
MHQNVGKHAPTNAARAILRKSEDLNYTAAEAWYRAKDNISLVDGRQSP